MNEGVEHNLEQEIGTFIKKRRKELGMTLQQMADKTGLSTGYLSLMERGINSPTIDNLHKICRAIGTVKVARKMSYGEFSSLYALIRFGKALGLEEARKLPLTDRLLIELMPAPMILGDAENRDEAYRDLARAKTLRKLTN